MISALTERQAAKRDQIARAARKLFLELGFAGSSMDAISSEAGVSKQTLYTYFPAKVDLVRAILDEELSRIALDGAVPQPQTLPELREVLIRFASGLTNSLLHPDSVALIRLILGEAFRIPELRGTLRQALPLRALHFIAAIVGQAGELGLIAVPDPDLAARMLLGPIMTYVALDGFLTTEPVVPPSQETLVSIVDHFLLMFAVRP